MQLGLTALVAEEIARGKLPGVTADDAAEAAGMFVLAMGKMGARELNYSSDIDLIVLFDETRHDPDDYAELRRGFIRVTQRLVKLLSEVTAEGYVFRTDLRLRPDPSVTPVCIATEPAEHYYESLGRTWERAAYIKARPCAGAIAAGEAFLDAPPPLRLAPPPRLRRDPGRPRHAAAHPRPQGPRRPDPGARPRPEARPGRHPRDRVLHPDPPAHRRRPRPRACASAPPSPPSPRSPPRAGSTAPPPRPLAEAYVAHRELEHRLQMLEDAQTQRLPDSPDGLARLVDFCGGRPAPTSRPRSRARLETVHALTEPFFVQDAAPPTPPPPRRSSPTPTPPRATMAAWRRLPAFRTERARAIFRRLEPELLRRIAGAASPDAALSSLDAFLSRLPSGVQLFSLMEANPPLLDLLVDICATAPELARYLGRNAGVLDAVISPDFYRPLARRRRAPRRARRAPAPDRRLREPR